MDRIYRVATAYALALSQNRCGMRMSCVLVTIPKTHRKVDITPIIEYYALGFE
jgi:hypothetical protein